jgi:DNA-binding NarL/FixJ family response regulator
MIRIIAIDDHPLILKALENLINEHDDIQLIAVANHGSKLIGLVRDLQPDIAIVDLGMSTGHFDPISTIKNLKEQFPNVKVLVLTSYDDGLWVREMVDVGVSGYMLKSDDFSLGIVQAIRALYAGGKFFSPQIAEKLIDNDEAHIKLTQREKSVLLLLADGKSTEIIANSLGVSEKRIRNLLVTICDKLEIERNSGISLRIAAVNKARKLGLIPGNEADPNMANG